MIVDFDDFQESEHRLDLIQQLHDVNPAFKCTLFAIPGKSSQDFWDSVPQYCELAVHGWTHPNAHEAEHWSYEQAMDVLLSAPVGFQDGWKSPGWLISDGTYQALMDLGFWCADQKYNDDRRPEGLSVHRLGDGDHWHGHIPDVCDNGISETFPMLLERVIEARKFEFVSEVVRPWVRDKVAA